jgi:mono/diheme cytochrome c family protein
MKRDKKIVMNRCAFKAILFFVIFLFLVSSLNAQEWTVPVSKKKKVATFLFSDDSRKKGETLFNTNCVSCHGNPGKNNFANLTPSPGDPASEDYQDQTDGEMYYKITNGKSPMPSFKSILAEEDRWNIISFIRSFNKSYIQPKPSTDSSEAEYSVDLKIEKLSDSNRIKVTATATSSKSKDTLIVKGADVSLYAKRYFGLMQIGVKKTTDANGEVVFNFPEDIPGDTSGYVNLTVKLNDEIGDFGEGEATAKMLVGKATHPQSLIDTRAMWSVSSNAPYWVKIAYLVAVLIVAACIGFILHQLHLIYKLGRKTDHNKQEGL